MVTFWARASLPSWTALSAAIMMEIFRVLAEGTGVSPSRLAVSPVARSLRYQLVWKGRASHSAFIRVTRSRIRVSLHRGWSWLAGPPARFCLVEAGTPVDEG